MLLKIENIIDKRIKINSNVEWYVYIVITSFIIYFFQYFAH